MGLLNKNIEATLETLDASEQDKKILKDILYVEHVNRERNLDSTAAEEISRILRENTNTEE